MPLFPLEAANRTIEGVIASLRRMGPLARQLGRRRSAQVIALIFCSASPGPTSRVVQ
jgi:hypothetical protein